MTINENDTQTVSVRDIISGRAIGYDSGIAAYFKSIEVAVVYNHITFWLKHNKVQGVNQIQGKTWMYQTFCDMAKQFGHLSEEQIKYAINKLVNAGILIKDNFNKTQFDKTSWYALSDESALRDENARSIRENSPIGEGIVPLRTGKFPSSIYNDKDNEKDNKKVSPPTQHNIKSQTEVSSLPVGLADFLFSKLKEINPKKKPPNSQAWAKEIDYMIRIDKRSEEDIKKVISFIVEQHKNTPSGFTWSVAIQSADKLREHFDAIWLQIQKPNPKKLEQESNKKKIETSLANKLWMQKVQKIIKNINAEKVGFIQIHETGVMLKVPKGFTPLGFSEYGFVDQVSNFLRMNGLWTGEMQFKGGQDE